MRSARAKNVLLGCAMALIATGSIVSADLAIYAKKSSPVARLLAKEEHFPVVHIKTPEVVKGIYLTSATPSNHRMDELIDLADKTELNAMVIDIKDSYGKPAYESGVPLAKIVGISVGKIDDPARMLRRLHEKGIYAIARIAVFQDPALASSRPDLALRDVSGAIWEDRKGVRWVDPAAREVWEYNAALATEAIALGFDEVNFDYVRFASDGATSRIRYPFYDNKTPKWEVMRTFFKYVRDTLGGEGVPISADLFGITLWRDDDVNIGQRFADALVYFDYLSPMLYPSHFPAGFEGWANPANYPYEIYKRSVSRGQATRASTTDAKAMVRPWIQDFDIGANYDAEKIRAQIRGAMEEGATGWMLWNARNVYTEDALEPEGRK